MGILLSDDVIPVYAWLNDRTRAEKTRRIRRLLLTLFSKANGKLPGQSFGKTVQGREKAVPIEEVVKATERVLDEIKARNGVTIYSTARRFVDWMIENDTTAPPKIQARSPVPSLNSDPCFPPSLSRSLEMRISRRERMTG